MAGFAGLIDFGAKNVTGKTGGNAYDYLVNRKLFRWACCNAVLCPIFANFDVNFLQYATR